MRAIGIGGTSNRMGAAVVWCAVVALAACSTNKQSGGGTVTDSARGETTTMTMTDSTAKAPATPAATPPKADADMQQVLDQLAALGGKPLETLTPQEARKQPTPADAVKALLKKQGKSTAPQPVGEVMDRTIPGAAGNIPARIYVPKGNGPFPVLVYYHGGGWVIANKDVYDASPRALVNLANCVVVSVDYRQGPEHKFPAAHDDAFAAYQWVLANAKSIKGDSSRVAVGGESAGGGLAVSTAMMARDKGVKLPVHMMVVYPIAGTDTNTASYLENANAKPLGRGAMEWFFKNYLNGPADYNDPRVNLVAANLKGLPPATIVTDQIDPLRSEGQLLADKLKAAGVQVEAKNYDGVTHEFFGMGAVLSKAKDAEQFVADGLKKSFGGAQVAGR
jgi:acetyl esterase/lipase